MYDGNGNIRYETIKKAASPAVTHLDGAQKYWYDLNGNMTTRVVDGNTYNLAYDAESRLVGVSGAASASFLYDGDGKRVKGIVNGTTTTYIGSYFEWTGTITNSIRYYYAGSQRIALRVGNDLDTTGLFWLTGDHLGSTTVTADNNGIKYGELRYKAWGENRYTWGSTPTTYRYTGQREESSFGLYFYNARWYDPALGRFVQADTIIPEAQQGVQAWDRYAYVNNNPILFIDPSGHVLPPGYCPSGCTLINFSGLPKFLRFLIASVFKIIDLTYSNGATYTDWKSSTWNLANEEDRFIAGTIPPVLGGVTVSDDLIKPLGEPIRKAAGDIHHMITVKIDRALNKHATLKNIFELNKYLVQAIDEAAHKGYEKWHRQYDDIVVEWIKDPKNKEATPEEFLEFLMSIYQGSLYPELILNERFPGATNLLKEALILQRR